MACLPSALSCLHPAGIRLCWCGTLSCIFLCQCHFLVDHLVSKMSSFSGSEWPGQKDECGFVIRGSGECGYICGLNVMRLRVENIWALFAWLAASECCPFARNSCPKLSEGNSKNKSLKDTSYLLGRVASLGVTHIKEPQHATWKTNV